MQLAAPDDSEPDPGWETDMELSPHQGDYPTISDWIAAQRKRQSAFNRLFADSGHRIKVAKQEWPIPDKQTSVGG